MLLGYSFTGIAVFGMMQCLGEMATWLPLPGSIPQFCARYVDDALGFAVGWNVSYSRSPVEFGQLTRQDILDSADFHVGIELVCLSHHLVRGNLRRLHRDSVLERC